MDRDSVYALAWTYLWLAIVLIALSGCRTNPILADPCYAATIHVDTLTMEVDSVTYEWTPGDCDDQG